MKIDYWEIAILLLFRAVLGLAFGVSLGNGVRELRTRQILMGFLRLLQAAVPAAFAGFMHLEIEAYHEYPFLYWGVFALTAIVTALKTDSVLKTLFMGFIIWFGVAFLFVGGWMILSGLRLGFILTNLIGGAIFALIGGAVLGALIYPYLKGKSVSDD